jgi:DNA-binding NtrC family response regulator
LLAKSALAELAAAAGRNVDGFTDDALEALRAYRWPGNLRELRNVIECAVVLGEGPLITLDDLLPAMRGSAGVEATADSADDDPFVVRLPSDLATLEARAVDVALRVSGGNRTRAAALLGISRVTLYKKLAGIKERERVAARKLT